MVAIDLTANKFFVYSEGGLLSKRVDYNKIVKEHGDPLEVSNDGRNFIFRSIKEKTVIHIYRVEVDEFKFIKTIDIFKALDLYVDNAIHTAKKQEEIDRANTLKGLFEHEY
jgi:hypothetical protein